MRRFFTQAGPSRLGDHLITALDRYADAGILDHFAHLPNQGLADAALAEVMRRTAHLDDMDVVRDAFQLFGRATMLHRFNYASGPEALEQFVAEFMGHVDRLRQGFYLQNGLDPESPQRSVSHWSLSPQASSQLSTIVEEDETEEEDFYTPPELPAGGVPVEPSSSDERRGPPGLTPWPTERTRLTLPPESSPATNLGSFELLRRPSAGSDEQSVNLDHVNLDQTPPSSPEDNSQVRTPQDEQRERVLDRVAQIREHYNHADEIRFWQLAHLNVTGALDGLPNRALADRFMIQLILHDNNLGAEFNRIGRDQVEQIFANGTDWTTRRIIRLLENIRARPYPGHRQEDIWAYVGSFLNADDTRRTPLDDIHTPIDNNAGRNFSPDIVMPVSPPPNRTPSPDHAILFPAAGVDESGHGADAVMEVFYPALHANLVPQTLNARLGDDLGEGTLFELLDYLGDTDVDPEVGAANIARVIGELPDHVFTMGLSAAEIRNLIQLRINNLLAPDIFLYTRTRNDLVGLMNQLIREDQQYREVQRAALSRTQRPREAPMLTQRADVARAAVAQQGENARQLALARFDELNLHGVVDRLNALAGTNNALANGLLLEMVMADHNFRDAFQAIPDDQVMRIFQAAPAWTARRFMALLHDVDGLMGTTPDVIRRFVEEQLMENRRRN